MPVAAAVVAFFIGIMCTSTRSKPKLAVESLGVTLLTHTIVLLEAIGQKLSTSREIKMPDMHLQREHHITRCKLLGL
jgi:hypothetical protein